MAIILTIHEKTDKNMIRNDLLPLSPIGVNMVNMFEVLMKSFVAEANQIISASKGKTEFLVYLKFLLVFI